MNENIHTVDNNERNRMRKVDLLLVGTELVLAAVLQPHGNSSDLAGLAILTTAIGAGAAVIHSSFSEEVETLGDNVKAAIIYGTIFTGALLANHHPDAVSSTISSASAAGGEVARWASEVAKGGGAVIADILKVLIEHPIPIVLGVGAVAAGKGIQKYRQNHPPTEHDKDPRSLRERSVTALRDGLGIALQVSAEVPGLISRIMKGVGERIRATKSTPPNPPRE